MAIQLHRTPSHRKRLPLPDSVQPQCLAAPHIPTPHVGARARPHPATHWKITQPQCFAAPQPITTHVGARACPRPAIHQKLTAAMPCDTLENRTAAMLCGSTAHNNPRRGAGLPPPCDTPKTHSRNALRLHISHQPMYQEGHTLPFNLQLKSRDGKSSVSTQCYTYTRKIWAFECAAGGRCGTLGSVPHLCAGKSETQAYKNQEYLAIFSQTIGSFLGVFSTPYIP